MENGSRGSHFFSMTGSSALWHESLNLIRTTTEEVFFDLLRQINWISWKY